MLLIREGRGLRASLCAAVSVENGCKGTFTHDVDPGFLCLTRDIPGKRSQNGG